MHYIQRLVRDFFGFSRSQTNGFILLLPLLALIIFSEPIYRWWISHRINSHEADVAKLDSLISVLEFSSVVDEEPLKTPQKTHSLFEFNPNEATIAQLQALGFTQNVSMRIEKYRLKGGKFKVKADLLKIYGMDSTFYSRLFSYIQLPEKIEAEKKFVKENTKNTEGKKFAKFNLNEADTAQLKSVHGIGDKLSLRIVKYRESLGGFISLTQLREVYGLDSGVVSKLMKLAFVDDTFKPHYLNLNMSNRQQLSSHPYLTRTMADAIVAYRFQHGNFNSLNDLSNVKILDQQTIQKIAPYLVFETEP